MLGRKYTVVIKYGTSKGILFSYVTAINTPITRRKMCDIHSKEANKKPRDQFTQPIHWTNLSVGTDRNLSFHLWPKKGAGQVKIDKQK